MTQTLEVAFDDIDAALLQVSTTVAPFRKIVAEDLMLSESAIHRNLQTLFEKDAGERIQKYIRHLTKTKMFGAAKKMRMVYDTTQPPTFYKDLFSKDLYVNLAYPAAFQKSLQRGLVFQASCRRIASLDSIEETFAKAEDVYEPLYIQRLRQLWSESKLLHDELDIQRDESHTYTSLARVGMSELISDSETKSLYSFRQILLPLRQDIQDLAEVDSAEELEDELSRKYAADVPTQYVSELRELFLETRTQPELETLFQLDEFLLRWQKFLQLSAKKRVKNTEDPSKYLQVQRSLLRPEEPKIEQHFPEMTSSSSSSSDEPSDDEEKENQEASEEASAGEQSENSAEQSESNEQSTESSNEDDEPLSDDEDEESLNEEPTNDASDSAEAASDSSTDEDANEVDGEDNSASGDAEGQNEADDEEELDVSEDFEEIAEQEESKDQSSEEQQDEQSEPEYKEATDSDLGHSSSLNSGVYTASAFKEEMGRHFEASMSSRKVASFYRQCLKENLDFEAESHLNIHDLKLMQQEETRDGSKFTCQGANFDLGQFIRQPSRSFSKDTYIKTPSKVHVDLVIDASGSMQDFPMTGAKAIALLWTNVAAAFPEHVKLRVYATSNVGKPTLHTLSSPDEIVELQAQSSDEGFRAYQTVIDNEEAENPDAVFVVTDGVFCDASDTMFLERLTKDIPVHGIYVSEDMRLSASEAVAMNVFTDFHTMTDLHGVGQLLQELLVKEASSKISTSQKGRRM